ncbi:MAG TPA: hypothetical protein VKB53_07280 [Gammaproteobacteria bacterium]|nr:hypothetical protein [Gammaproteobacteria bacterium]
MTSQDLDRLEALLRSLRANAVLG